MRPLAGSCHRTCTCSQVGCSSKANMFLRPSASRTCAGEPCAKKTSRSAAIFGDHQEDAGRMERIALLDSQTNLVETTSGLMMSKESNDRRMQPGGSKGWACNKQAPETNSVPAICSNSKTERFKLLAVPSLLRGLEASALWKFARESSCAEIDKCKF